MINMTSKGTDLLEKCQICEKSQKLWKPNEEELRHLQDKLESLTNSGNQHSNWLQSLCTDCKKRLDDLWEFKILCKNAYRKYLDIQEAQEMPDDYDMSSYDVKDDYEDSEKDRKIFPTEKMDEEEEEKKYFQSFEMVMLAEETTIDMDLQRKRKKPKSSEKAPERPKKKRKRPENKVGKIHKESRQKLSLPGPYTCAICDKQFIAKQNIRQHVVVVHKKTRNFLCNFCGRKCVNRQSLIVHEQTHNENRPRVPCEFCKETFSTKHTLNKHLKLVHAELKQEERFWICQQCSTITEGRYEYYEHLKTHTDLDRFRCRYCRREFSSIDILAQHESIHVDERPFTCKICSKTFKQNAHLTRHMNIHTRARKFPCNFCDKVFSQASNRKVHIRLHTGETPYECSNCRKRFSDRKLFKNHCVKCSGST
ncbi:zinc finger protein OZF-like [Phlebotomus argentipes]|uniref:zinc finger protein OZF-like n=1 Tax=Phlebotomus argentipes TaxID=94469 RepID=UPI0028935F46|nr:zinc finger protein OZF-like [Phlebotomus argentipes]